MKISGYINQNYQQTTATSQQRAAENKNSTSKTGESAAQSPVDLGLIAQGTQSSAAIRIPTEGYASKLSGAEKKALDAIFTRYRENPILAERLESSGGELGRILDVKV